MYSSSVNPYSVKDMILLSGESTTQRTGPLSIYLTLYNCTESTEQVVESVYSLGLHDEHHKVFRGISSLGCEKLQNYTVCIRIAKHRN